MHYMFLYIPRRSLHHREYRRVCAREDGRKRNRLANKKVPNVALAPNCKGEFAKATRFNMMFNVGISPSADQAYLRPETCQSIFVDFARVFKTMRGHLPLGIAQVGKSSEMKSRQGRVFYA